MRSNIEGSIRSKACDRIYFDVRPKTRLALPSSPIPSVLLASDPGPLGSPADHPEHDFDVAISFSGSDREYAETIVSSLKASEIRVFFDSDYSADMWGQDLVEYFEEIYRKRARFAIILISESYAKGMWTRHERRSAPGESTRRERHIHSPGSAGRHEVAWSPSNAWVSRCSLSSGCEWHSQRNSFKVVWRCTGNGNSD